MTTNEHVDNLFGCVDIPFPDSTLSGSSLLLSGWVLSRNQSVPSVTALLDGQPVAKGHPRLARPDVASEQTGVQGNETPGFLLEVPFDAFPDGWHELTVTCDDGEDSTVEIARRKINLSQEMSQERRRKVRQVIACPKCHGGLRDEGQHLSCGNCAIRFPTVNGVPAFHEVHLDLAPLEISVNPYGPLALDIISKSAEGLVLDCGAGYPKDHFPNVIQFELFRYPSTDVVGDALELPFHDAAFDGIISQAVLEHVPDPFQYAAELYRVLKPGGLALVDSAFLQPLHGYPHHFFNTTLSGLRHVMRAFEAVQDGVGPHQEPWVMLRWVLGSYLKGITDDDEKQAVLNLTLGEVMELLRHGESKSPFDGLSPEADEELAAGVYFLGRKPERETIKHAGVH